MVDNEIKNEVLKLFREADSAIDDLPHPCTQGCSYCCYEQVRVSSIESPLIKDLLNEYPKIRDIIQGNVLEWFKYFNENTPDNKVLTTKDMVEFELKMLRERRPCPFLVDFNCTIYKVRPIVCRTYVVDRPVGECIENLTCTDSLESREIRIRSEEKLKNLVPDLFYMPLLYSVIDIYDLKLPVKSIAPLASFEVIGLPNNTLQRSQDSS